MTSIQPRPSRPSPPSPQSAASPLITAELRDRLTAPHLWFVATVDEEGAPHVTPMWVGTDGDTVWFNTAEGRIKERNLRRDPRVTLAHVAPDNPFDRVWIRGRVESFTTGPEADADMDALARAYAGTERYELGIPGERRVTIRVRPERVRRVVGVEPMPPGTPGSVPPSRG
ncbi:TIGR03618 family F420-dependent PPOX class oxidoreductase [Streptomyces sp. BI20]|uniref:TIGR03618 family F420-dependent PPOX class oxidoreductase n=1 Tax=Streptomyces sp. BI20 TaxID=3403460 RepID=UPI003C72A065